MELIRAKKLDFVLRVYGWNPPCVSIGRHQTLIREIDMEKLIGDGFGIVRRPTGGRAVWHETELTYSIAARLDHPLVSGSISDALRKTSGPMIDAIKSLGIDVAAKPLEKHTTGGPRTAANPCFTSHGKWEIGTPDGKKLVGSAQARSRGVFLEHGSILLKNDQLKILDYLPVGTPPGYKTAVRHHLETGIACLHEFKPDLEITEMRNALRISFCKALSSDLKHLPYDKFLTERFRELECEYRNEF